MIQVIDINTGCLNSFSTKFFTHTLIAGPSGSGKTTLLKAIAGTIKYKGLVYIDNVLATKTGPARNISVVWQDHRLLPNQTVEQNIKIASKNIKDAVDLLKIGSLLNRYPSSLSGGEAQRVNIARGISSPAKYVLMDEPLSGIDSLMSRNLLQNILEFLNKRNKIVLLVHHEFSSVFSWFNQIKIIKDGSLKEEGDLRQLYEKPNDLWTANFFGSFVLINNNILVRHEWLKIKKGGASKVIDIVWNGPNYKVFCLLDQQKVCVYTDQQFNIGDNVHVWFEKYKELDSFNFNDID